MGESPARSASAEKNALRRKLLDLVRGTDTQVLLRWEDAIRSALLSGIREARPDGADGVILGTVPMAGEPDLRPLLKSLLQSGHRVALPSVRSDEPRGLRLIEVERPEDLEALRPGALGTREPVAGRELQVSRLGLMLVPGVAFTSRGERLGRGGGFFDALLGNAGRRALAIGVAFECQVVPELPTEPHDAVVDWLCTERGLRATA